MKKINLNSIVKIQLLVLLYSLVSVLSKTASNQMKLYGLISFQCLGIMLIMIISLMIYAFFWQKVLKKTELSVAYVNKGLVLFWSMLWSVLLFGENITIFNMIGTVVIVLGILVVSIK